MHRVARRLRPEDAAGSVALWSVAVLGLVASLLFVSLTLIWLFGPDGSGTEVLGSRVERPDPVESTETSTTTSSSTAPAATSERRGDLEVASTVGGAFFVHAEDPADRAEGSATVIARDEDDVRLTVSGTPHDERATIRATVENGTDDVIVFADGLSVVVHIDHEGAPWRTVEPADRSITELRPGGRATVTTEVTLDRFGHYDLTGDVFFARRSLPV